MITWKSGVVRPLSVAGVLVIAGLAGCGSSGKGTSDAAAGGETGTAGGNGGRAGAVGIGGASGTGAAGRPGGAGTGGAGGASGLGGSAASAAGTSGRGGTTGGGGGAAGAPVSMGGTGVAGGGRGGGGASGVGGSAGGAPSSTGGAGGGGGIHTGLGGALGSGGAVGGTAGAATSMGGAGGLGGAPGSGGLPGNGGASGGGGGPGGSGASGQRVPPHILFIFDTSTSMEENAAGSWVGESTNICPGMGAGPRSKIYGLKAALRAVLTDIGTLANVGLMSFPMQTRTPPPYSTTAWCHVSAAASVSGVGHYSATPAKPNRSLGCDMTTHDSETTFGAWFTAGIGEVLRAGVTTAPPGAMPMPSNYDPPDANSPVVRRWIDNQELPLDPGEVVDPELHGLGYTPLGRSLLYARLYFDNYVKPADPSGACRRNMVVLLTDGAETCDMAAPDSTFDTATCMGGGASFSPFHPLYQACRLRVDSGIKTYVITDNMLSAAELANNDRIASAGGTAAALPVSLADSGAAKAAIQGAIAGAMPPPGGCAGP